MNESDCCPQIIARFSFVDPKNTPTSVLHRFEKGNRELVEYKAMSMIHGHNRKRVSDSISLNDVIEYKGIGHTLLSLAIPGSSAPFRSPIRSAFWRAVTPGGGRNRRGGSRRGENRGYRCPEGYENGGRFTNSMLSTCGMRLFDIPGLARTLGLGSSSFRRAQGGTSTPTTPGEYADVQQGRQPNIIIPKVSKTSSSAMLRNIEALVTELGTSNKKTSRLVRRDGFVLEPVVPTSVLRVIPDNRNMKGSSYVMSVLNRNEFGRDELGLLSNSGVDSLVYVMQGGSTVKVSKNRLLSVGERRRLGRLVATASSRKNDTDPLAPIRYLVSEAGDYLSYEENFVGVRNPHQLIGNGKRERWVDEIFSGKGRLKSRRRPAEEMQQTESFGQVNSNIATVEGAIEYINNGGSLGDLKPSVLAKLLAYPDYVKRNDGNVVGIGSRKYTLERRNYKYGAISERLAEDMQQFLGTESPDVFPVGKGDRRSFLRERPESAIVGSSINRKKTWNDMPLSDIAGMLVSDILTDKRDRRPESVIAADLGDRTFAMSLDNGNSGLTNLSDIEISKRLKMRIDDLLSAETGNYYSQYYKQLKAQQQAQLRKMIANLIQRARKFNFDQFKDRLSMSGELSSGEKIHINVMRKIVKQRIRVLSNVGDLRRALDG